MTATDYRLRLVLFAAGLLLGAYVASEHTFPGVSAAASGESLDAAIRRNVAAVITQTHQVKVQDPQRDIAWLDAPAGDLNVFDTMAPQTFLVLARPPGAQARDLYRLQARVTPYGRVFAPSWTVNLTHTIAADDGDLTTQGPRVATTVSYQGHPVAVQIRNLGGEDPERAGIQGWSRTRLWGNAITNLEQTGDRRGIDLDHYSIQGIPPAALRLQFSNQTLQIIDRQHNLAIAQVDLATHQASGALPLAHMGPDKKMTYNFLNWLADRGRGLADKGLAPAWAGSSIELMKEVYFKAKEVQATVEEVAGPAEPVEVETSQVVEAAKKRARFQAKGSALPWPPAPIEPLLPNRLKGEGIWQPVSRDVVTWQPNAPAPFYRTFIRAEPDYKRKKIHIVVWDPAQVSLLMRAGTRNPEPQTGERGDGRIPRVPETLRRVIGGFNGGFQTAHIWYGMMVDRRVLLRPREYGATAGSWADGRTAFGTWRPRAPIPQDLTHYRQNLPPLLENGVFNPYRRHTWGWHRKVAGAKEGKTIRSAICYTRQGYVMYAYSEFSAAKHLANALAHVGCWYAIHLDMNPGHTGFEFYRLLAEGQEAKPPGVEADVAGLRFQGTTMHPTNQHMKAPTRYLGADYRDFFYLQLRPLVPGADLSPLGGGDAVDGEGQWQTEGFPHNAEQPPRVATTWLRTGDGTLRILQLDPRGLALSRLDADTAEPKHDTLIATVPLWSPPKRGAESLTLTANLSLKGGAINTAPTIPIAAGLVAGVDPNGFLWLVDVRNATIADAATALAARGVTLSIWRQAQTAPQSADAPLVYQSTVDNDGHAALVEMPVGELEGEVRKGVSRHVARLVLSSRPRLPRIVRLFPDMKPKTRKR